MSTQIQIRRDTTANWESVDPTLADGEIGFDVTVNRFKVGDGVKAWTDIEYSGSTGSELIDGEAYIRLEDGSWVASPSMTLDGDLNISGNIVIDGEIVDPDGNPSGGGFVDAPDDGAQYARQSVNSKMVWSVVSGESLVHVGEDAPDNPATGQLWFDTGNGTLNLFDGDDWLSIGTGSKTIFTLPVSLRDGVVQLPVSEDADSLPVLLRSGEFAIPLNQSGDILAVNTRGGEIQLPLAA